MYTSMLQFQPEFVVASGMGARMTEMAIEIKEDGSASLFCLQGHYRRQYRRLLGRDGSYRWVKRTANGFTPISERRARRLERKFRHPETAKTPQRFPRLKWERKAGQPVYCPAFGFGKIVAIVGDKIVVKLGKKERVMGEQDLMTLAQAEADWHLYWVRGERRRLEEGKRLSNIKSLCRLSGLGEWQAFLDKFDYPRSTADDLIRRYHTELRWEARTELTGNRASQEGEPERHINERRPDPDDDERNDLIAKEAEKRRGKEPSHHKTSWSIRINLPPDIVTLCRKRYKRKSKSAKAFWQRAAYIFVKLEPPHKKHRKSHRHREQPKFPTEIAE